MNYENYPCPGCGSHLHEEDDVVVCPVCATPQHRSCWLENNKCVNDDKHAEGFVWAPEATITPPAQAEKKSGTVICHICGSENPAEVSNCGHCGALLGVNESEGSLHCNYCGAANAPGTAACTQCGAPLVYGGPRPFIPETGSFSPNEMIGEHTASELASYVRSAAEKYLPEFRKIESGERAKFNWAAFFFGPLWFFFRKIYKFGIIFCALVAAISLVFAGAMTQMSDLLLPYAEQIQSQTISQDLLMKLSEQMFQIGKVPFAIGLGALLVINLIAGIIANKLYYKKIVEDMKMISEQVPDSRMRSAIFATRGGRSFFSAVCGLFVYETIGTVFTYIADFVADKF